MLLKNMAWCTCDYILTASIQSAAVFLEFLFMLEHSASVYRAAQVVKLSSRAYCRLIEL